MSLPVDSDESSSTTQPQSGSDLLPARQAKVPYFDDIRSALNASSQPDFIVATAVGGQNKMVAFRRLGLSADFPELNWISIVDQELSETRAAINGLNRDLLLVALAILVVTVGLSFYVSARG